MADGAPVDAAAAAASAAPERSAAARARSVGAQGRAVLLWKLAEYGGLIAFTALLPPMMGPRLYGHFAAMLSAIGLLTMAAALGTQATFGRFVPEFETRGEHHRTRGLFAQLFVLRMAVVIPLAVLLGLLLHNIIPDATPRTALYGATAFASVGLAMVCYQLLYGLNRLGRSLTHDALIKIAILALVPLLGAAASLERAALALLLAEAGFLVLGLAWTARYFTTGAAARDWSQLPAKLRYGLSFFLANVLLFAVWRGGELAVLILSGRSREVAYYSVANAVALAFAALLGQLGSLLVPSLTTFHIARQFDSLESWLSQALKYLTISAFIFVFAVYAAGAWLVHTFLGDQYLPVVVNLKILGWGLVPLGLVRVGMATALVHLEARKAVVMGAVGLVSFLIAAEIMVPHWGSTGAAMAAVLASAATGLVAALLFELWPLMRSARYGQLLVAGAAGMLVFALPIHGRAVASLVSAAVFVALVFLIGVVSADEMRRLARVIAT
jgi:O-antigen/teichoic acid export membrane protein